MSILFEYIDLVLIRFGLFLKRRQPSRFINFLAFHTVTAIIDATASLRHFRLALARTSSERILSESSVFVIVCAVAFNECKHQRDFLSYCETA